MNRTHTLETRMNIYENLFIMALAYIFVLCVIVYSIRCGAPPPLTHHVTPWARFL